MTSPATVWVVEQSTDGGPWMVAQQFGLYKSEQRCRDRAAKVNEFHASLGEDNPNYLVRYRAAQYERIPF